jgi:hypothetical protein
MDMTEEQRRRTNLRIALGLGAVVVIWYLVAIVAVLKP